MFAGGVFLLGVGAEAAYLRAVAVGISAGFREAYHPAPCKAGGGSPAR